MYTFDIEVTFGRLHRVTPCNYKMHVQLYLRASCYAVGSGYYPCTGNQRTSTDKPSITFQCAL